MTLKDATKLVNAMGFTLRKTDGEYRLARKMPDLSVRSVRQAQASAYYTDSLDDVIGTAHYWFARLWFGLQR